jgi:hypothetical protein
MLPSDKQKIRFELEKILRAEIYEKSTQDEWLFGHRVDDRDPAWQDKWLEKRSQCPGSIRLTHSKTDRSPAIFPYAPGKDILEGSQEDAANATERVAFLRSGVVYRTLYGILNKIRESAPAVIA